MTPRSGSVDTRTDISSDDQEFRTPNGASLRRYSSIDTLVIAVRISGCIGGADGKRVGVAVQIVLDQVGGCRYLYRDPVGVVVGRVES